MAIRPYDTADDLAAEIATEWAESFGDLAREMGAQSLPCEALWQRDGVYAIDLAGRLVPCEGRIEDAKEELLRKLLGGDVHWAADPKTLARVCAWYASTYGEDIEPVLDQPDHWWGLYLEWADYEHSFATERAKTKAAIDALCNGIRDICRPGKAG